MLFNRLLKFYCLVLLLITPLFIYAAPPSTAVKFVILKADNNTVGNPVTVTIEAQKQNNQIDANYQNDITLVTSGSATGGGLVDIVNGQGTIQIRDSIPETVTLSLSDTQNTGLDVSSTRTVTFSSVSFNQFGFWFRDDDGTEATATGYGNSDVVSNTSITDVDPGKIFRLRFDIKAENQDGSISPGLYFKQGSGCDTGTWTQVTTSSNTIHLEPSQNFNNSDATTRQLVPNNFFVPGQILSSTNPASSVSVGKNQHTEYEWSLRIATDVALGSNYSFRIEDNGQPIDKYNQCPSLTVVATGGGGGTGSGTGTTTGGGTTTTTGTGTTTGGGSTTGTGGTGTSGGTIVSSGISATSRPMVIFSGQTFPGATVLLVDKGSDFETPLSQGAFAGADGTFWYSFSNITKGEKNLFALVIKDKENRQTPAKFFNINTNESYYIVKDILSTPTIDLISYRVTRGMNAIVVGNAAPRYTVQMKIDGKVADETKSNSDGSYKFIINTGSLGFGQHDIQVKQINPDDNIGSDFSITRNLTVSDLPQVKTDLNGDEVIDIKDWSIFLANWQSKDSSIQKTIDFNGDGKSDIADFSIFVRELRKK